MADLVTNETTNVDNSKIQKDGKLYIRLNINKNGFEVKRYKLETSLNLLKDQCPEIAQLAHKVKNPLEYIIRKEFFDGSKKSLFVRNLSFNYIDSASQKPAEAKILGLRPERLPGSFLAELLPEGQSLVFKGHIDRREFVVDEIYPVSDDKRLEYEAQFNVTCYDDPKMVTWCNLYDIANESSSLTKHTMECFKEWHAYLNWKQAIVEKNIFGLKYIKVDLDIRNNLLYFWVASPNKECFDRLHKHLRKEDLQVYANDYSTNRWEFEYDSNNNTQSRSVGLGRFKGVREALTADISSFMKLPVAGLAAAEADKNTIEDDSEPMARQVIPAAFKQAYITKVAFELSPDDLELVADLDLEDDNQLEYFRDKIISKYPEDGFLALSAVGSLALIKRLRRSIHNMEKDYFCQSPNLGLWLFDITKARLPKIKNFEDDVKIEKWLNESVAHNEHQRLAIKKMLAAPDVFLLQGPPGTGKTTMIAEMAYQLAIRGQRVLITSQSNDAVDNALDRLIASPEVRAVRLGRKSRQKQNRQAEAEDNKYSRNLSLSHYYQTVSQQLDASWLNKWKNLEERENLCLKDARDYQIMFKDLKEAQKLLETQRLQLVEAKEKHKAAEQALASARSHNQDHLYKTKQLELLTETLQDGKDNSFFLDKEQLDYLSGQVEKICSIAESQGILLTASVIPLSRLARQKPQLLCSYLFSLSNNARALEQLTQKLLQNRENSTDSLVNKAEIEALQRRIDALEDRINAIYDSGVSDADELVAGLDREERAYKRKLKVLQASLGPIAIPLEYKQLFNEAVWKLLNNTKCREKSIQLLSKAFASYNSQVKHALQGLQTVLNEHPYADEVPLEASVNRSLREVEVAQADLAASQEHLVLLENELAAIALRYTEDKKLSLAQLGDVIQEHLGEVKALQKRQAVVQEPWGDIMRGFKERLNDSIGYANELKFYQNTYISSCNAVGISCTDNMRDLIDNGFDSFDVVIVDEVSKATPPEILIPLMKGRKAVLVGDHRQLPPMFDEHENSYKELVAVQEDTQEENTEFNFTIEDFRKYEKMITASMFKEFFENADNSIKASMLTQYRMHSDISRVINRFYDGALENGLTKDQENVSKSHGLILKGEDGLPFVVPNRHAYWLDSSCFPDGSPSYDCHIGKSTSACNFYEAYMIVELLKKIAAEYTRQGYGKDKRKTVGVISFYQKQVDIIRRLFKAVRRDAIFDAISVDINTVDRFQGKEKNIIITSLVRNNKRGRASKHIVAFERINVAFSRAQELLLIIGAKHLYDNMEVELPGLFDKHVTTVPVYKNIIADMHTKGCYIDSAKVASNELQNIVKAEVKKVKEENAGKED